MCRQLLAHGASPDTPAVVVENAGRCDAIVINTDLQRLPSALAAAGNGAAIMIVGQSARDGCAPVEASW
jgi:siroheme synthase